MMTFLILVYELLQESYHNRKEFLLKAKNTQILKFVGNFVQNNFFFYHSKQVQIMNNDSVFEFHSGVVMPSYGNSNNKLG